MVEYLEDVIVVCVMCVGVLCVCDVCCGVDVCERYVYFVCLM